MIGTSNPRVISDYLKFLLWSKVSSHEILEKVFKNGEVNEEDFGEFAELYEKHFDEQDYAIYQTGDLTHCFSFENENLGEMGLGLQHMLVEENLNFEQMKEKVKEKFETAGVKINDNDINYLEFEHYG